MFDVLCFGVWCFVFGVLIFVFGALWFVFGVWCLMFCIFGMLVFGSRRSLCVFVVCCCLLWLGWCLLCVVC